MSEQGNELRAKVNHYTSELMKQIEAGKSEALTQFLTFSSRFHQYSYGNVLLIYSQRPDATYVAGYDTWRKILGVKFPVKKGEKGIKIIVPYKYTKTNEEGIEVNRVSFGVGNVFDVSQTVATEADIPKYYKRLGICNQSVFDSVLSCMQDDGITVRLSVDTGRAEGLSKGGLVELKNEELCVLVHEYAHELTHRGEDRSSFSRQQRELHAEGIAFVVCSHFGVTIPHSSDYIINWGGDDPLGNFKREMDIVMSGAKTMIEKIEKKLDKLDKLGKVA